MIFHRATSLKTRLIDYCYAEARAIVRDQVVPAVELQAHRDATERAGAEITRALAEQAERIALAIEADAPPPHGHVCAEPPWCAYCCRVYQAQRAAGIARRAGESR